MGRKGQQGRTGRTGRKRAGGTVAGASRRSRGVSLGSLLVAIAIVGALVIPAVRAIPSLLEYFSVKRAAGYAKQRATNKREVADYFDRQAQIDRISAVRGDDLNVREDENGAIRAVDFSYRSEVPLYGPLTLLITYSGTQ